MFLWRLLRWLTSVMRQILLPQCVSDGRLSHRLALLLMLLVLAIECLPATSPIKGEAHAFYTASAATIVGWFDAAWRPRLKSAAALGELVAELDRLYWLEAEAQTLLASQLVRGAELEAESLRLLDEAGSLSAAKSSRSFHRDRDNTLSALTSGTSQLDQLTRDLSVVEAELAHVRRLAEWSVETVQRVQTLRQEAEASRQRLEDYLALFNTADVFDTLGVEGHGDPDTLARELERRQRIADERAKLQAAMSASPLD